MREELEVLLARVWSEPDRGRCAATPVLCRYVADELSPEETTAFRTHLEACCDCQNDLAGFAEASRVWRAEPEAAGWLARLLWSARVLLVAGATAALLWAVWPLPSDEVGLLRPKGTWQLHVAVHRDGRTFRATPSVELQTGDRLGFFYSAGAPGHLMIVYATTDDAPVRLFPGRVTESSAVVPGVEVRLPDGALISPGYDCEWIVGLFAVERFDDAEAVAAVERILAGRSGCRLAPVEGRLAAQVYEVRR